MSRKNDIEHIQIPLMKIERTITIPLEEYKELLITKGRYQEIKEVNTLIVTEEEADKMKILNCREEK